MELRHLRYFVAVAEELSFTRAAARLGIAQPPLSQQIGKLERELEVRLFERGPRGVRLTTAGTALLGEARMVLARTGEATRIVRQVEHGRTGAVRVGSVASGFSGVLLDLLPAFRAAYPAVLPLVYEMEAVPQLEALGQGRIDIGFLRSSAPHPGVSLWPLRAEPLVAALPEDHELARAERVPLAALAGEPFVLFPRADAPEAFDTIIGACDRAGFAPDVVYEASNDHTLVALVASGLAVSLVPGSTSNLRIPGARYRPVDPAEPAATMSAAIPATRAARPAVNLLELARSRAAGERSRDGGPSPTDAA
ncbi:LysR substrate-binding domain-containing protein [Pseudonocardia adelaidensis]|uniref:LysR family transcriptional regulator n=1 Tax=Pseudonocardia adelaidensis TaxID=648754 RepID=A0ABP9P1K8_9PSEU